MHKVYVSPSDQVRNAYAVGDTTEAEQCRKIAVKLVNELTARGIDATTNVTIDMSSRIAASNAWGADLHVCIHTNACNGSVAGTRMFCHSIPGDGYNACKAIAAHLNPITPGESDNITTDTWTEIVRTNCPCAYVEVGFHDNAVEAQWIIDHVSDIAHAMALGICEYFSVPSAVSPSSSSPAAPESAPDTSVKGDVCTVELKVLTYGMNDPQVHAAMVLMKAKGYYPWDLSANDNLFGAHMKEGLGKMQADHNLGVDYVLGRNSWTFLHN